MLVGHKSSAQSTDEDDQEDLRRTVLPKSINTPYIEVRPLISPDGQTLYFGRREHPDNIKGERDLQDIYVAEMNAKGWSNAKNLGDEVNNKFANSICSISPDGQQILVMNTYSKIKGPVVTFTRNGNNWEGPFPVEIERYYNNSEYIDFYMDFEREVLFMALEREDSRGEQDIYVSFKQEDGIWSQPVNAGPNVNSNRSDFAPFLGSDGRTLFFCSYGWSGLGGADIYYSHRLDDTYTNWSLPVNMGKPVNTSGEETYVSATIDLKTLYFVSYRHGSAKRDIISLPLKEEVLDLPPLEAAPIAVAVSETVLTPNQPQKLSTYKKEIAAVADEKDAGQEVAADTETNLNEEEIVAQAGTNMPESNEQSNLATETSLDTQLAYLQEDEINDEEEGNQRVAAGTSETPEKVNQVNRPEYPTENIIETYTLSSGNAGTITSTRTVNLATNEGDSEEIEIPRSVPVRLVSDSKGNQRIDLLKNIYFNFNQANLAKSQAKKYLTDVAQILLANPEVKIKITGHADEMGNHKANLAISKSRARAVKDFLQSQGVNPDRLLIDYKGELEPLASNDDERDGRELNRRVAFQVIQ